MNHPYSLAEETILITGGGTGLGFGMAKCFVQCGAKVVLVGRRSEVLKKAAAQLGETAVWEAHDILQLNSAGALIGRICDKVGPITGLVNNAGIHIKKSALELSPEEFLACAPGLAGRIQADRESAMFFRRLPNHSSSGTVPRRKQQRYRGAGILRDHLPPCRNGWSL